MSKNRLSKTQELAIQTRLSQLGAGVAIAALILCGIYIQSQDQTDKQENLEIFLEQLEAKPQNAEDNNTPWPFVKEDQPIMSIEKVSQKVEKVGVNKKNYASVGFQETWIEEENSQAFINWSVLHPVLTHSYTVEKSENGVDFEAIGTFTPSEFRTSRNIMDFRYGIQESPFSQMPRMLYRIKHMGMDGQTDYSPVVSRRLPIQTGLYSMVEDGKSQVKVFIASDQLDSIKVEVLDDRGRILATDLLLGKEEAQLVSFSADSWKDGICWLRLQTKDMTLRESFKHSSSNPDQ